MAGHGVEHGHPADAAARGKKHTMKGHGSILRRHGQHDPHDDETSHGQHGHRVPERFALRTGILHRFPQLHLVMRHKRECPGGDLLGRCNQSRRSRSRIDSNQ
jgi:hypothetical protein